jgi:uncharacterized alpha-E superfamily protein
MLSRVADSIFWMFRYIERAENIARFMDVNFHLSLDLPFGHQAQWEPLIAITGDVEVYRKKHGRFQESEVIQFLTFDAENPNSLISVLRNARENARSVREIISSEMWEQMNKWYLFVAGEAEKPVQMIDLPAFFRQVKNHSHLFTGLFEVTMSHGEPWHFARLGTLLERADQTTRLLDVKYFMLLPHVEDVGSPFDSIQWAAVLKSASALEMYRKRFHRIFPTSVVSFLLFDPDFPRAVRYCVSRAQRSLHTITGSPSGALRNEAEARLGKLRAELDSSPVEQIIAFGIHEYLDAFQTKLNEVGTAVYNTFFAHRPVPLPVGTDILSQ